MIFVETDQIYMGFVAIEQTWVGFCREQANLEGFLWKISKFRRVFILNKQI